MKKFLRGKKTYIVAAGSLVGAAWGVYTGQLTSPEAVQLGITALLGATIRHGTSR